MILFKAVLRALASGVVCVDKETLATFLSSLFFFLSSLPGI
jgi:hypothetical protein